MIEIDASAAQNEMPASIQLIAPPFHEKLLYRIGSAYEQHTSFSQRAPNL